MWPYFKDWVELRNLRSLREGLWRWNPPLVLLAFSISWHTMTGDISTTCSHPLRTPPCLLTMMYWNPSKTMKPNKCFLISVVGSVFCHRNTKVTNSKDLYFIISMNSPHPEGKAPFSVLYHFESLNPEAARWYFGHAHFTNMEGDTQDVKHLTQVT